MRILFALFLLPSQLWAWEFTPQPICTLLHANDTAAIKITYDPAQVEYRLDIARRDDGWAPSPGFGMAFEGGRTVVIGTDRHVIDGSNLTVRDSGFGNVLNGLEFNRVARAYTATQMVRFSLGGASEPVRQFRDCTKQELILSSLSNLAAT